MTEPVFNYLCPLCGGPIHITNFSVKCDQAIKPTGWGVIVTPKVSKESESFRCPKCEVTVPCDWVYREMPEEKAKKLMGQWGADPHSIYNHKEIDVDRKAARAPRSRDKHLSRGDQVRPEGEKGKGDPESLGVPPE